MGLLFLPFAGCGHPPAASMAVVDFIRDVDLAERRPLAYDASSFTAGGRLLPAIVGPAPGRLTWLLPMPHRGRFKAEAAARGAPVRVRVGISDNRAYEGLGQFTLQPGAPWTAIDIDLSPYAGWKPSLFYRPDGIRWRFVLSADAISGMPATVAWGLPQITAPREEIKEYVQRVNSTTSQAPTPR